ncbi:MAG: DUF481 domain-containing protein [Flavobacteriaceae bacterium]|nr:DUF481 domain-containing protein [Flavobacteriaceae bacterium]
MSVLLTSYLATSQMDSIVMSNGDVLIGEIKGLDKSVLIFKTKYSDKDFQIKWLKVTEIYSSRYFIASLNGGDRFSSTISSIPGKKGRVNLDVGVNAIEEDIMDVIYLDPIGKNHLSRLTLDIDIGFTLSKSNNFRQFMTNLSGNYAEDRWISSAYFNSVLSRQDDTEDLRRIEGDIDFIYYLPHSWFLQTGAEYLGNDEQKLNLRSTYKVGSGYFFKRNNEIDIWSWQRNCLYL